MSKQNKNGMTLIEVLVAVAIIAILMAGLYSAGTYADKQARIKHTESTIVILSAAIEQYRDFYGKFPDISDTTGMPANYASAKEGEKWYCKLTTAPDAKIILNKISPSLIKDADKNGYPEVVDSWGTAFKYTYAQNDNFPVITSAGPNRIFEPNSVYIDDITSR